MDHIADKINGRAWVVLNKKKGMAARVHALYTKAGIVHVGIYDYCTAKGPGAGYQTGKAGGYGYDKLTAAMRGLVIDGIKLNDHCGQDNNTARILKQYHNEVKKYAATTRDAEQITSKYTKRASKIGASFANWDIDKRQYSSLYLKSGLEKLEMLGYMVISAL